MRCLYCDKKLSLVQSFKKETFCSEEHREIHRRAEAAATMERILRPSPAVFERAAPVKTVERLIEHDDFELTELTEMTELTGIDAAAPPSAPLVEQPGLYALNSGPLIPTGIPMREAEELVTAPVRPRVNVGPRTEIEAEPRRKKRKRRHASH
jgi:hypothetical protein